MLTSSTDVLTQLRRGSLKVFPLDERDVGAGGIALRLGTEFVDLPKHRGRSIVGDESRVYAPPDVRSVSLGERIYLPVGGVMLISSLQIVALPRDLVGSVCGLGALVREGISVTTSEPAHPSFVGKLTFEISNYGDAPASLYAGMRIAWLTLYPTEPIAATMDDSNRRQRRSASDDIEPLKQILALASENSKSPHHPVRSLVALLEEALVARRDVKGRQLETFARELLQTIEGLKIISVNLRTRAEEIDILVQNDLDVGFWRHLGSPILVECKNWSSKVGAREIGVIYDKLASLGDDAKTAILIAPGGISGDSSSDAWLKVRELRQKGRLVLVLDDGRLDELRGDMHPTALIERAYQMLWFI